MPTQCNADQHTLSQFFDLSGAHFQWTHVQEYSQRNGERRSYYDEYRVTLWRGGKYISLGIIPVAKKLFGPTQFDFLKVLREQLDRLYGNTDEFEIWSALFYQKHAVPGTRPEFEQLVALYVSCKKLLGYWFPLLRAAQDDLHTSPGIGGEEWEQLRARRQMAIEEFLASETFKYLVHLLLQGTLPRVIVFRDAAQAVTEQTLLTVPEASSHQILEVPLLDLSAFFNQAEESDLNVLHYLEQCVEQQCTSLAQLLRARLTQ